MSDNVCQVDINKVLAGNGFGKSFPNVVDVVSSSEQSSVDKSADIATNADMDIEMDDSASREDENRSEEVGCAEDDSVKDYPKQIFTGNDILELYNICDFCHGPIFRVPKKGTEESRRYCCPKCQSAHSKSKSCGTKKKRNSTNGDSESKEDGTQNSIKGKTDDTGTEHEFNDGHDFNWTEYKEVIDSKGAPISCFKRVTKDVKGLEAGMKLEALDKNNPCNYCVATVIDVVGHRVQVCYDGFGDDEGQDFWCNFQAEELFPIGWCAGNGYPLQPPTGISSSLEDWKTFLTKTLTGALAAPVELFRESELRMQLRVHSFQAGMKIECVHPKRPDVICAATVTKSLGPYLYQVSTDVVQDTPPSQFYGHSETQGVFQTGWTSKQAMRTCKPVAKVLNDGPDGKPCIQLVRTSSGLTQPAKRPRCNRFKAGHKLEAVDLLNPSIIRVATVVATVGRLVLLYFDGANKFQFVDCESEEIYPSGWCLTTGHPLHASYGIVSPNISSSGETSLSLKNIADLRNENHSRIVRLPSFKSVVKSPEEPLHRKLPKEGKGHSKDTSKGGDVTGTNSDDPKGKFCIYVNPLCRTGPYVDPQKVEELPLKMREGRLPSVLCNVIELLLRISVDRIATTDLLQEVTGARLFTAGKGVKLHKKSLQRFDTKERAAKLLKRVAKKLKFCEYLFSINSPRVCLNQCQPTPMRPMNLRLIESASPQIGTPNVTATVGDQKKSDAVVTFDLTKVLSKSPNIIAAGSEPNVVGHQLLYKGRPLLPIAPGAKQIPESGIASVGIPSSSITITPVSFVPPMISQGSSANLTTGPLVPPPQRLVAPINIRLLSSPPAGAPLKPVERGVTTAGSNVKTLFVVKNKDPRLASSDGCQVGSPSVKQVFVTKDLESAALKVCGSKIEHGLQTVYTRPSPAVVLSRPGCIKKADVTHLPFSNIIKSGSDEAMTVEAVKASISGSSDGYSTVLSTPALSPSVSHFPGGSRCIIGPDDAVTRSPRPRAEEHLSSKTVGNKLNISSGLLNVVKVPRVSSSHGTDMHAKVRPRTEPSPTTVSFVQLRGLVSDKAPSVNHSLHVISSSEALSAIQDGHPVTAQSINVGKPQLPVQMAISPGVSSPFHIASKSTCSAGTCGQTPFLNPSSGHLENHSDKSPTPLRGIVSSSALSSMETNPLKVLTSSAMDASSPLHSPPPLRPAPAGSLRTVALRSPPHLIPSATNSPRFEFPSGKPLVPVNVKVESPCVPNDMFTKGVQVSPGSLSKDEGGVMKFPKGPDHERLISSPRVHQGLIAKPHEPASCRLDPDSTHPHNLNDKVPHHYLNRAIVSENQLHSCSQGNQVRRPQPPLVLSDASTSGTSNSAFLPAAVRVSSTPAATTTVTVTLTYVPLQSNSKDKVVYVPVNQPQHQNSQKLFFYQQPGSVSLVTNPMSPYVRTSVPSKMPNVSLTVPAPKPSVGNVQANPSAEEASRHFATFRIQGSSFKDIETRVREAVRKELEEKDRVDREKKKAMKRRRSQSFKQIPGMEMHSQFGPKYQPLHGGESPILHAESTFDDKDSKPEARGDPNSELDVRKDPALVNFNGTDDDDFKVENDFSHSENSCDDGNQDEDGDFEEDDKRDEGNEEENGGESGKDRRQDWRHRKRKRKSLKKRFTRRKGETTLLKVKNKGSLMERDCDSQMLDDVTKLEGAHFLSRRNELDTPNSYHKVKVPYSKIKDRLIGDQDDELTIKNVLIDSRIPSDDSDCKKPRLMDGVEDRKTIHPQGPPKKLYITDPLSKVQLPKNPETWSTQDVAEFIKATDCAEYANKLVDQEIDGQSLLLLTREALMEFTGMKLGPALKICSFVAQLKARLRMQQLAVSCM